MKIAIAGAGDLSHYFYEEFTLHGHDTIALTRTFKAFLSSLSIEQRITDYSIPDLVEKLSDCEAFQNEEPRYMTETREPVQQALKAQCEVQWTLVLNGWYILPAKQRYFADLVNGAWSMDHERKVFTMYEDGLTPVTLTSARDTARAVARLVERSDWEEYTHLAGETLTWTGLYAIVQRRDSGWKVSRKSYGDAVKEVDVAEESGNGRQIEKAKDQRCLYFQGLHFRGIEEIMDEAGTRPDAII
ncbi:hypothetical protein BDW62DRAFT_207706 [Aspergillus aurantiobrunneus]